MEKKTKSTSAKTTTKKPAVKKPAAKKVETKVVETVEKTEKVEKANLVISYVDVLNKIFYSLVVIIVLLALLLVTVVVKGNTTVSKSTKAETEQTEEEAPSGEYDVSMMDTLSTTDAIARINGGEKTVVYIGRATCGYCVKFLPTLQKAQSTYKYKTVYIDLEQMTSEDQTNLIALDNEEKFIEESLGYTPMVMIFEDGKLKDTWLGYAEYDSFAKFLEDNGFKK